MPRTQPPLVAALIAVLSLVAVCHVPVPGGPWVEDVPEVASAAPAGTISCCEGSRRDVLPTAQDAQEVVLPAAPRAPAAGRPSALPAALAGHPGAVSAPAAPGTGWPALDAAVLRIPGYTAAAPVRWSLAASGPWGSTLWPADTVTVSRRTPPDRLDDVVRHEWAHVLQDRVWAGDTGRLLAELDAAFGGAGTTGAERAADCMARALGATWTYYTPCADPSWRAAAGRLLAGQHLAA